MVGQKRLGLVLDGGGAMGAWQFGVLKAFKAAGLKFDVVAGTSVGALNGFLWAADAMVEGRLLWRESTFTNVFPLKRPKILSILFALVLLPARAMLAHAYSIQVRKEHKNAVALAVILPPAIALALIFTTNSLVTGEREVKHPVLGFALMLIFLHPLLAWVQSKFPWTESNFRGHYQFHYVFGLLLYMPATILCVAVFFSSISIYWKAILCISIWAIAMAGMARLEEFLLKATILDSKPLASRIAPLAKKTLASSGSMIVTFAEIDESQFLVKELKPYYVHLEQIPLYLRKDFLLASASLPVGLVSPALLLLHDGRIIEAIDGGVVDNRPLLPVINGGKCDEIIVVCFEKKPPDVSEDLIRYDGKNLKSIPVIKYCVPSKPVGGRLCGALGGWIAVLRFDRRFIRSRLIQGRKDGRAFIASLGRPA